jgi:hypothetical protein
VKNYSFEINNQKMKIRNLYYSYSYLEKLMKDEFLSLCFELVEKEKIVDSFYTNKLILELSNLLNCSATLNRWGE